MSCKKLKKSKNKEELPSFLLKLDKVNANSLPQKNRSDNPFLGPIFFGACVQYHPFHHSVHLGETHLPIHSSYCKKNTLNSLFLPKVEKIVKKIKAKPVRLHKKVKKLYRDLFEHHCPGFRKVFVPDVRPLTSLGETASIIEGETSREIPLCRVKSSSSRILEGDFEIFTLSDMREKKRSLMSHKDRMAHAHFLKEFATVRIIGPTIPAAITITKLPTKRKRISDIMSTSDVVTKIRKTDTEKTEMYEVEEKEEIEVREKLEEKEIESMSEEKSREESFVTTETGSKNKESKMTVEADICFADNEEIHIVENEIEKEKSIESDSAIAKEVKSLEVEKNEPD